RRRSDRPARPGGETQPRPLASGRCSRRRQIAHDKEPGFQLSTFCFLLSLASCFSHFSLLLNKRSPYVILYTCNARFVSNLSHPHARQLPWPKPPSSSPRHLTSLSRSDGKPMSLIQPSCTIWPTILYALSCLN